MFSTISNFGEYLIEISLLKSPLHLSKSNTTDFPSETQPRTYLSPEEENLPDIKEPPSIVKLGPIS